MLESSRRLVVIDVRTSYEYDAGHLPGAVNIPHTEIEGRLADLIAQRESGIVLYCMRGPRARVAENLLLEWDVGPLFHLKGGFVAWKKAGYAIEKSPACALCTVWLKRVGESGCRRS